jgi:hypothetical protein
MVDIIIIFVSSKHKKAINYDDTDKILSLQYIGIFRILYNSKYDFYDCDKRVTTIIILAISLFAAPFLVWH